MPSQFGTLQYFAMAYRCVAKLPLIVSSHHPTYPQPYETIRCHTIPLLFRSVRIPRATSPCHAYACPVDTARGCAFPPRYITLPHSALRCLSFSECIPSLQLQYVTSLFNSFALSSLRDASHLLHFAKRKAGVTHSRQSLFRCRPVLPRRTDPCRCYATGRGRGVLRS